MWLIKALLPLPPFLPFRPYAPKSPEGDFLAPYSLTPLLPYSLTPLLPYSLTPLLPYPSIFLVFLYNSTCEKTQINLPLPSIIKKRHEKRYSSG